MPNGTAIEFENTLHKYRKFFQKNPEVAQQLYSALCNQEWYKPETGEIYSCSWRYAGGLVSCIMGGGGDYMSYYCSGNEGSISELIEGLLAEEGWIPYEES